MSDLPGRLRARLSLEWNLFKYGPVDWFLLSGNRLLVSLFLLTAVAALLWGLVLTGVAPLVQRTPTLFLLFAFISGNFTLVTIVVSISQFVLTRHLESPDEIRRKTTEMMAYREDVARTTRRSVVPIRQSDFFLVLFRAMRSETRRLETEQSTITDSKVRAELSDLTAGLTAHADYVIDLLGRPETGLRHALFTALNTGYEGYVYRVWSLNLEHEAELSEEAAEPLERLVDVIEQVDVASRLFKTVYIQSELARLSRLLLYVGLPVQILTVLVLLLFTASASPFLSTSALSVVVPAVLTLGFAPFVVLVAYVLRLTTVARRTAAMYPFAGNFDHSPSFDDDVET